jgi:hypothetical protein
VLEVVVGSDVVGSSVVVVVSGGIVVSEPSTSITADEQSPDWQA